MKLLKQLTEQKNEKITAMEEMLTREVADFKAEEMEELKRELADIDNKIKTIKETEEMVAVKETREIKVVDTKVDEETRAIEEVRAQEDLFIRAITGDTQAKEELRAMGTAGSVLIPTTIAKDIVKQVEILSPAYAKTRKFGIPGKLKFVLEDTTSEIQVGYVDDNAETPESQAAFKEQLVDDFQIRGLVRISKSLIGKSQFDLRGYVVEKISKGYVKFIEKEIFNGTKTAAKIQGVVTIPDDRKVKLTAGTVVTVDHIIDLECLVPSVIRGGCEFYVNPKAITKLRKIKDADNNYVLQKDLHNKFVWNLMGYTVYESDQVDENHIFFADMSGYYAKEVQGMEMQTLVEKYATYNQLAYHAVAELGGAPVELQKLAMIEIAQA